jgi:biotin synthase
MIGVGPNLSHPDTPLGSGEFPCLPTGEQAPNTEEMVYKVLALTRQACPRVNIPATTALATINTRNGRELGLMRGANVVMPNLSPVKHRKEYALYDDKICTGEEAAECLGCLSNRIRSAGFEPDFSRGDYKGFRLRETGIEEEQEEKTEKMTINQVF